MNRMSRTFCFAVAALGLALSTLSIPAVADVGPVSIGTISDAGPPLVLAASIDAAVNVQGEDANRMPMLAAVFKPDRARNGSAFAKCRDASYHRALPVPWRN